MPAARDPYDVLDVSRTATDAEVRSAYRKLVKLHHPDHNNGSEESEQRFEEIQAAYARIAELRKGRGSSSRSRRAGSSPRPPRSPSDPHLDARMADLERELREANAAKDRARQAAREAARAGADPEDLRQRFRRATDEELGYVTTDDSFSKILAEARDELSGRLSDAREHPVGKRVESVIEDLEELLTRATRGSKD